MTQELISHLSGCPVMRFRARSVMTDGDKDRKTRCGASAAARARVHHRSRAELLAGRIDIAVHSLKDLPTAPPGGLALAVTPPRADPLDALCGRPWRAAPGARSGPDRRGGSRS